MRPRTAKPTFEGVAKYPRCHLGMKQSGPLQMYFQLLKPMLESQTQPVQFRVAVARQSAMTKCDGYTKIVL